MENMHGISLGMNSIGNKIFLEMRVYGKLTHEDYQTIVPMLDNMINSIEDPQINVLIDARLFEGWELKAAWDDFKFGIKNLLKFNKIAVVGNSSLKKFLVKLANWFMPSGEIKYFETINDAYEWISIDEKNLNPTEKEIYKNLDEIEEELIELFKNRLKIIDTDVPEANDQEASEILIKIYKNTLEKIKQDVKEGRFKNY